ncbi:MULTISPECIES: GNAT family N-acetyltransferase [Asticcacaulis]|uniref:GNAT family N-acetyltransferase n=1 Tax=Asticcacaulis TaxID=76890 RepID=UPI0028642BFE|nr:GNAT family N-acetyltransferase [Asticcacaulis sp. BE141]MBP2158478.1 putative GNAT superfamily acetyltransferase [Asticcacaulis solisilvae]MDR6799524.1 putative GNAT superfamily acetyltransferase [Asticcacaulis sp. BE141]
MLKPLLPDNEAVRALNNVFAAETSYIEAGDWARLVAQARVAVFAAPADAFLLVLDHDADYDSPNFLWWKERRDRFLYVDRVVVAATAQGRGLGRQLYAHAVDEARRLGFERIVCEINIDPPNPGSVAFHTALGFTPAGEQKLSNGKTVGYFELEL